MAEAKGAKVINGAETALMKAKQFEDPKNMH